MVCRFCHPLDAATRAARGEVMGRAMYRLAALLGITPSRLDAMLTAEEKADWLAYLNDALH